MEVSLEQSAAARRRYRRARDQAALRRARLGAPSRPRALRNFAVAVCRRAGVCAHAAELAFEIGTLGFPHNARLACLWANAARKALIAEAVGAL